MFQCVATTRKPDEALATTPDYPLKRETDAEEESYSSEDDDDVETVVECPAEKRATRKRTLSLPGPHICVTYTKQLVYHEKADMRKSFRLRHRSDSCGSKKHVDLKNECVAIKRGESMPAFKEKILEEKTPVSTSSDEDVQCDGNLPRKPLFGCGVEGDDFTGLEDEPPTLVN